MSLSTFHCIAAITQHSAGFAEAARGDLDARSSTAPTGRWPTWCRT